MPLSRASSIVEMEPRQTRWAGYRLILAFIGLISCGVQAQSDPDIAPPCLSNPCQNGALCFEWLDGTSYVCICPPGFTGSNCEIEIDECASDPCLNGATCFDFEGFFYCLCPSGFSGARCEIDVSPCNSGPCQNGGNCSNVDAVTYTCTCLDGYTGDNCQINNNECSSDPCENGGMCVDEVGGYRCECITGWTGVVCETDIDECASNPCVNGGICTDQVGYYDCECSRGWTGTNCETAWDVCEVIPCLNGATCIDFQTFGFCLCAPGYTGVICETALTTQAPTTTQPLSTTTLPPSTTTTAPVTTTQPTTVSTMQPTTRPTTVATTQPTTKPTTVFTTQPTTVSTTQPTSRLTTVATTQPTTRPTTVFTTLPTTVSTTQPTSRVTTVVTTQPTTKPTTVFTTQPTTVSTPPPTTRQTTVSTTQTARPTTVSTPQPTTVSTTQATTRQTTASMTQQSTTVSSGQPTNGSVIVSSTQPTITPSVVTSSQPSMNKTALSTRPTLVSTIQVSTTPTTMFTTQPTTTSTVVSTAQPTTNPITVSTTQTIIRTNSTQGPTKMSASQPPSLVPSTVVSTLQATSSKVSQPTISTQQTSQPSLDTSPPTKTNMQSASMSSAASSSARTSVATTEIGSTQNSSFTESATSSPTTSSQTQSTSAASSTVLSTPVNLTTSATTLLGSTTQMLGPSTPGTDQTTTNSSQVSTTVQGITSMPLSNETTASLQSLGITDLGDITTKFVPIFTTLEHAMTSTFATSGKFSTVAEVTTIAARSTVSEGINATTSAEVTPLSENVTRSLNQSEMSTTGLNTTSPTTVESEAQTDSPTQTTGEATDVDQLSSTEQQYVTVTEPITSITEIEEFVTDSTEKDLESTNATEAEGSTLTQEITTEVQSASTSSSDGVTNVSELSTVSTEQEVFSNETGTVSDASTSTLGEFELSTAVTDLDKFASTEQQYVTLTEAATSVTEIEGFITDVVITEEDSTEKDVESTTLTEAGSTPGQQSTMGTEQSASTSSNDGLTTVPTEEEELSSETGTASVASTLGKIDVSTGVTDLDQFASTEQQYVSVTEAATSVTEIEGFVTDFVITEEDSTEKDDESTTATETGGSTLAQKSSTEFKSASTSRSDGVTTVMEVSIISTEQEELSSESEMASEATTLSGIELSPGVTDLDQSASTEQQYAIVTEAVTSVTEIESFITDFVITEEDSTRKQETEISTQAQQGTTELQPTSTQAKAETTVREIYTESTEQDELSSETVTAMNASTPGETEEYSTGVTDLDQLASTEQQFVTITEAVTSVTDVEEVITDFVITEEGSTMKNVESTTTIAPETAMSTQKTTDMGMKTRAEQSTSELQPTATTGSGDITTVSTEKEESSSETISTVGISTVLGTDLTTATTGIDQPASTEQQYVIVTEAVTSITEIEDFVTDFVITDELSSEKDVETSTQGQQSTTELQPIFNSTTGSEQFKTLPTEQQSTTELQSASETIGSKMTTVTELSTIPTEEGEVASDSISPLDTSTLEDIELSTAVNDLDERDSTEQQFLTVTEAVTSVTEIEEFITDFVITEDFNETDVELTTATEAEGSTLQYQSTTVLQSDSISSSAGSTTVEELSTIPTEQDELSSETLSTVAASTTAESQPTSSSSSSGLTTNPQEEEIMSSENGTTVGISTEGEIDLTTAATSVDLSTSTEQQYVIVTEAVTSVTEIEEFITDFVITEAESNETAVELTTSTESERSTTVIQSASTSSSDELTTMKELSTLPTEKEELSSETVTTAVASSTAEAQPLSSSSSGGLTTNLQEEEMLSSEDATTVSISTEGEIDLTTAATSVDLSTSTEQQFVTVTEAVTSVTEIEEFITDFVITEAESNETAVELTTSTESEESTTVIQSASTSSSDGPTTIKELSTVTNEQEELSSETVTTAFASNTTEAQPTISSGRGGLTTDSQDQEMLSSEDATTVGISTKGEIDLTTAATGVDLSASTEQQYVIVTEAVTSVTEIEEFITDFVITEADSNETDSELTTAIEVERSTLQYQSTTVLQSASTSSSDGLTTMQEISTVATEQEELSSETVSTVVASNTTEAQPTSSSGSSGLTTDSQDQEMLSSEDATTVGISTKGEIDLTTAATGVDLRASTEQQYVIVTEAVTSVTEIEEFITDFVITDKDSTERDVNLTMSTAPDVGTTTQVLQSTTESQPSSTPIIRGPTTNLIEQEMSSEGGTTVGFSTAGETELTRATAVTAMGTSTQVGIELSTGVTDLDQVASTEQQYVTVTEAVTSITEIEEFITDFVITEASTRNESTTTTPPYVRTTTQEEQTATKLQSSSTPSSGGLTTIKVYSTTEQGELTSEAVTKFDNSTLGEIEVSTGVTDLDQVASTEQQYITVTEAATSITEIEEFITDFVITEEDSTEKDVNVTTTTAPDVGTTTQGLQSTTESQPSSTSSSTGPTTDLMEQEMSSENGTAPLDASTQGEMELSTGVTDGDQLASTQQQYVTVTEAVTSITEIEEFITDFVITEEDSTEKDVESTTSTVPDGRTTTQEQQTTIKTGSTLTPSSNGLTTIKELSTFPTEQEELSSEAVTAMDGSTQGATELSTRNPDVDRLASTEQQYVTVTEAVTSITEIEEFITDFVITEEDSTEKDVDVTTVTAPEVGTTTQGQQISTDLQPTSTPSRGDLTTEQDILSSENGTTVGVSTEGVTELTTASTEVDLSSSTEQQYVTVTEAVTSVTEIEEFITDFVMTEEDSTEKDVDSTTVTEVEESTLEKQNTTDLESTTSRTDGMTTLTGDSSVSTEQGELSSVSGTESVASTEGGIEPSTGVTDQVASTEQQYVTVTEAVTSITEIEEFITDFVMTEQDTTEKDVESTTVTAPDIQTTTQGLQSSTYSQPTSTSSSGDLTTEQEMLSSKDGTTVGISTVEVTELTTAASEVDQSASTEQQYVTVTEAVTSITEIEEFITDFVITDGDSTEKDVDVTTTTVPDIGTTTQGLQMSTESKPTSSQSSGDLTTEQEMLSSQDGTIGDVSTSGVTELTTASSEVAQSSSTEEQFVTVTEAITSVTEIEEFITDFVITEDSTRNESTTTAPPFVGMTTQEQQTATESQPISTPISDGLTTMKELSTVPPEQEDLSSEAVTMLDVSTVGEMELPTDVTDLDQLSSTEEQYVTVTEAVTSITEIEEFITDFVITEEDSTEKDVELTTTTVPDVGTTTQELQSTIELEPTSTPSSDGMTTIKELSSIPTELGELSSEAVTTFDISTVGEIELSTGVTNGDQLASTEQQYVTVTEAVTSVTEIEEIITDFVITEEDSTEKDVDSTTTIEAGSTPGQQSTMGTEQSASTSFSDGVTNVSELSTLVTEPEGLSNKTVSTLDTSIRVTTDITTSITDLDQLASTEQQYVTITEAVTSVTEIEEFITEELSTDAELTTVAVPLTSVSELSTISTEEEGFSSDTITTVASSAVGETELTTGVTDTSEIVSSEEEITTVATSFTEVEEFETDLITEEVSTIRDVELTTVFTTILSNLTTAMIDASKPIPTEQQSTSNTELVTQPSATSATVAATTQVFASTPEPVVTTDRRATSKPIPTTEEPAETTTHNVTTRAQIVTTDETVVTTAEQAAATTSQPVATTGQDVETTRPKVATTQQPSTRQPMKTSEQPRLTTPQSVTTEQPLATTQKQNVTTRLPATTTMSSTTRDNIISTRNPIVTTRTPIVTTQRMERTTTNVVATTAGRPSTLQQTTTNQPRVTTQQATQSTVAREVTTPSTTRRFNATTTSQPTVGTSPKETTGQPASPTPVLYVEPMTATATIQEINGVEAFVSPDLQDPSSLSFSNLEADFCNALLEYFQDLLIDSANIRCQISSLVNGSIVASLELNVTGPSAAEALPTAIQVYNAQFVEERFLIDSVSRNVFSLQSLVIEAKDTCAQENPCLNGATCTGFGYNSYNCLCLDGYVGDICEEAILLVLEILSQSATEVTIGWTYPQDDDDLQGFVFDTRESGSEDWLLSSLVTRDRREFTITGLAPDTLYFARLWGLYLQESKVISFQKAFSTDVYTPTPDTGAAVTTISQSLLIWILVIVALVAFVLFIVVVVMILRRRDSVTLPFKGSGGRFGVGVRNNVAYDVETQQPPSPPSVSGMALGGDKEGRNGPTTWEIPREKLVVGNVKQRGRFGELHFGKVYLGNQTMSVDVKKQTVPADKKKLLSELAILNQAGRHSNILNLVGACTKYSGPIYLAFDSVEPVRLDMFLRALKDVHKPIALHVPDFNVTTPLMPLLLQFAVDIASGLSHLASKRVVKHSLGVRNIALSVNLVAKVTDFGLKDESTQQSANAEHGGMNGETTFPAQARWMAYETLVFSTYTDKSNVWSLGVMIWEVMSFGHEPFDGYRGEELSRKLNEGYSLNQPDGCLDDIYEIIQSCLRLEASERPTLRILVARLVRRYQCIKMQDKETRQEVFQALAQLSGNHDTMSPPQIRCMEMLVNANTSKELPQARLMAVQYAATAFPGSHVASKFTLLSACADETEVVRTEATNIIKMQARVAEMDMESDMPTGKMLPPFTKMITLVRQKAFENLPKSSQKSQGPLGVFTIPFQAHMYEKVTVYLRMCLAYSAGVSPNTFKTSDMKKQGPTMSRHVNDLIEMHKGDAGAPIATYAALLRQYVSAIGGGRGLYSLLELVAMAPDKLSQQFVKKIDSLKLLLHSDEESVRLYTAQLMGIVLCYAPAHTVVDTITSFTAKIDQESTENSQALLWAVGFIIGRQMQKEILAQNDTFSKLTDTQELVENVYRRATETVVEKLESSNPTIVKAACTALAEIARNGPLPLPKGGKTNGKVSTKGSESTRSKNGVHGPTKLSLVQRLGEILNTDSVLYMLEVKKEASRALSHLMVGEMDFPYSKLVLEALQNGVTISAPSREQHLPFQFHLADSLATALQGHTSYAALDPWLDENPTLPGHAASVHGDIGPLVQDMLAARQKTNNSDQQDARSVMLTVFLETFRHNQQIQPHISKMTSIIKQAILRWDDEGIVTMLSQELQKRILAVLKLARGPTDDATSSSAASHAFSISSQGSSSDTREVASLTTTPEIHSNSPDLSSDVANASSMLDDLVNDEEDVTSF